MRVEWDSKTKVVLMTGKHKAHKPRFWSVRLHISNDNAKENMVFKPKQKLTMEDMDKIVGEHLEDFVKEHGEITFARFTATAR